MQKEERFFISLLFLQLFCENDRLFFFPRVIDAKIS